MIIKLSPVRSDNALTVVKNGDALTINDQVFDFTPLPDGATLPADAIGSEHFEGQVERITGELHVTLRLPHGPNPPEHVAFPAAIHAVEDGPINLPVVEPSDPLPTDDPLLDEVENGD